MGKLRKESGILFSTIALQKSRMGQIQGFKAEAVVFLPRSLDNTVDAVLSAFPKGKKHGWFVLFIGFHLV